MIELCLRKSSWQLPNKLSGADYRKFFELQEEGVKAQLVKDWGEAPGEVMNYDDDLLIPGTMNGNIFVTVQPPRGFGEDPSKIYHSPFCAPTHHYLGFYHWLRDIWQADAVVHVGTHGSLNGCLVKMPDSIIPVIRIFLWAICLISILILSRLPVRVFRPKDVVLPV